MPRLTEAMIEGAVVAWRKRAGDPVRAGEIIAEVQADKTTVDLEAPESGILGPIVVPAGSDPVRVGTVLALLQAPSEAASDPDEVLKGLVVSAEAEVAAVVPRPTRAGTEQSDPAAQPATASSRSAVEASPLARSMAQQVGLDLWDLAVAKGGGRVGLDDVLTAIGEGNGPVASSMTVAAPGREFSEFAPPWDEVPHSPTRQVIARRLGEAKRTVPHYYLAVSCQVDALRGLRAELQEGLAHKLTLNDYLIRAAALALRQVPEANASWAESGTRRYRRVDVAVAVATDAGLIAPIVRDADRKGLAEIATELRELIARARAGRLRPEEYQGGTFTVSNLGMYGIDEFFAIVNPPQAGILGIGRAEPRPVVRDGHIVAATVMTCTLSADHRVLDGAVGARFLAAFRNLVERPLTMLL